ncbi:MAG: sulfotransferase [Pseudomonadota bacterium]|nr:sulfotransferase [Pseudomonadota bacterium]
MITGDVGTVGTRELLFVGGAHGRCGTTLLKRLLCSHPAVTQVVPGESRLWEAIAELRPSLAAECPFYAPVRSARLMDEFRRRIRDGFGDTSRVNAALDCFGSAIGATAIRGSQAPPRLHAPAIGRERLDAALQQLCSALLDAPEAAPEVTHICEKTPSNAQFAELVLTVCPDARLIVMTRDPFDVALSHTQRPWGPRDPIDAAAYTRHYFRRWERIKARLNPVRFLEVDHAQLVREPQATLYAVLGFAGLTLHEPLLALASALIREPISRRHTLDDQTRHAMDAILESAS